MLKEYFRYGLRTILKHRVFLLINVIGLSIGMASAFFISLWVQNELSFDQFHEKAENILILGWTNKDGAISWDGSPYLLGNKAVSSIPELTTATQFRSAQTDHLVFHVDDNYFTEKNVAYVDLNWFRVFSYGLVTGETRTFGHTDNGLAITENIALKYFGSSNVAGRSILINNKEFLVQAVLKNIPSNSSLTYEIFLPARNHFRNDTESAREEAFTSFNWKTALLVKNPAAKTAIVSKLNQLISTGNKEGARAILTPLTQLHLDAGMQSSEIAHGSRNMVILFISLGLLILLISCANYINFTTAGASLRVKEMSVKKIVGASRASLFMQVFSESLLTNIFALVFTMAIIFLGMPYFNSLLGKQFNFEVFSLFTARLFGILLIITTLANGIYPALLLSSLEPAGLIRNSGLFRLSGGSLRKVLVTAQFVIAITLITGSLVMYNQLYFISQGKPMGKESAIFSLPLNAKWVDTLHGPEKENLVKLLKRELGTSPGVEGVTAASESLVNIKLSMSGIASWPGKADGFDPMIYPLGVDEDYNNIFKLHLTEGRWFLPADGDDRHNYILNETAVQTLGLQAPVVGKTFALFGDTGKIVGVVKDFHFRSFHEKIGALVMMNRADFRRTLFVRINPASTKNALADAGKIWRKIFSSEPFEYSFLDETYGDLYKSEIRSSGLIGLFSWVAILLTCMGLYGLVAFSTEQKAREIGIRKVLGASVTQLVMMLSGNFVKLMGVAALVAVPLAWWCMDKWLQDFTYRVHLSWWIFALALLGVGLITFFTIGFKAYAAGRANPVKSIRTE